MELTIELLIKLGAALLVGGLIGAEREFRDKAAGFRTIIFITVGATLFTIFSAILAGDENDPARVAANIVTGIGFLGAGAIMREGGRVAGLTTAATIWLSAALGMGIGSGQYLLVAAATIVILFVLWIFPIFEHWIDNIRESRTYKVHIPLDSEKATALDDVFNSLAMHIFKRHIIKSKEYMICTWTAQGTPKNHEKLIATLLSDKDVLEFDY
ncbi:MAG: MgtC/SapB family protein [Anaerolineales bacterium]|nr:MgtC/SapB family protein [Anaerolineales bacterium]